MKTALVILAESFEEIEAISTIDILRRAGVETTVAACHDNRFVTGRNGIRIVADELFTTVLDQRFDLLVLPGGPGVRHLRKDPRVIERVRRQENDGGLIGAICAAPTLLHDAGLLDGRRYTAHPSVANELKAIDESSSVVVDERIITSRGAGTAVDFALALVEKLVSHEKAAEIRDSIRA